MKPVKIEFVKYGVANRFSGEYRDTVEVNYRLEHYPKLYDEVMKHELAHEEDNTSMEDLAHDMKSRTPGLFKFMIRYPSTWIQVLPIYWHRKRKILVYDENAFVSWIILIAIMIAVYLFMPVVAGLF